MTHQEIVVPRPLNGSRCWTLAAVAAKPPMRFRIGRMGTYAVIRSPEFLVEINGLGHVRPPRN